MASSRRLDISSLLCDDDQPAFSPLDALVQAATQERRRLDATTNHQLHHHHHHHQLPHPPQPQSDPDRVPHDRHSRIEYDRPVHNDHHIHHHQRDYDYHHIHEQQQQQQQQQQQLLHDQDRLRELELHHHRLRNEQRQIERERQERERDRFLLQQQQQQQQQHQHQHQLLLQQQHAAERQREQDHLDILHRQHRHQPSLSASRSPSISHLISHPTHRPQDPAQISPLLSTSHILSAPVLSRSDLPPFKKRRYSQSPTDDRERIAHDRDKMFVGELGYGRVESPIAGPSYPPAPPPPRRPASGHGPPRKPVSVSDLLADKDPPQRPHSREPETSHRVVSPLGRRSPPGSQIGRAKAARKSDDHLFREPPPVIHVPLDPQEPRKSPKEEFKVKQEPKQQQQHHPRPRTSSFVEDTRPKKLLKESVPAPPAPPPTPPPPPSLTAPLHPSKIHIAKPQQDAHEWFLQHYDEDLSPTSARPEPPHTPSPSLSPVTPAHPHPPPVSVKISPVEEKPPLTPITSAVVSLEQELEDLVSESTTTTTPTTVFIKKQEPDIDIDLDVDLAVTELVDNMEEEEDIDVKRESRGLAVDVEDELLSLVDDRPPPPPPPSASARRAPGSAGSSSHGSAVAPLATTGAPNANVKPTVTPSLPQRPVPEAKQSSPPVMSSASTGPLSSISAAARQPPTRPTSDRESMPPPASVSSSSAVKKATERAGSAAPAVTPAAKKKKEPTAKAAPKAKAATAATGTTTKTKAKPAPKPKKGTPSEILAPPPSATATAALAIPPPPAPAKVAKTAPGKKTAPSVSASRSRSASVMPTSVGPESDSVKAEKQEEEEESEEEKEDDKLYCVCKTKYDEDRFMIACDRCDEWYHTQCVHMPDLEVDLVDQFICPPCVEKNPHLNLRTTYKIRCLYGLRHPDPSSTKACHKAARGAFSKYCSDECGVKYMQSRIDNWAKKGGKTEKLWESVKNAEKREGVVVCAAEPATNGCVKTESSGSKPGLEVEGNSPKDEESVLKPQKQRIVPPKRTRVEQETDRLTKLLDSVIKLREEIKRDMEVVGWRERLLKLATDRAEAVGQCGWDQRLCMDDEEWADAADSVFESYEDVKPSPVKEESAEGDTEAENPEEHWCPGKVVCDRHGGWQNVRSKDVAKEKAKMEEALEKLTTREREIRKNIEDRLDSQATTGSTTSKNTHVKETSSTAPLKSANTKVVNGNPKSKTAATTGDALKKGKKRKAPA